MGVHQGSALNPLLFVVVLEALSKEVRTGFPWELLFADVLLMFKAVPIDELLVKLKACESEMEKKDLRVNMDEVYGIRH